MSTHPSIGGKEQEPPEAVVGLVLNALLEAGMRNAWSETAKHALNAVPPGWMKTEQGWVQMELCWLIDNVEAPPGTGSYSIPKRYTAPSGCIGCQGCACGMDRPRGCAIANLEHIVGSIPTDAPFRRR